MSEHCTCPGTSSDDDFVFDEDGEIVPAPAPSRVLSPRRCWGRARSARWTARGSSRSCPRPCCRLGCEARCGSRWVLRRCVCRATCTPRRSLVLDPVKSVIPSVVVPASNADADDAAAAADIADDLVVFPLPPPWYPSFPKSQYSWYFRSNGATYVNGTLTVQIVRHLWNRATQEFVSTDRGTLVLTCRRSLVAIPLRPHVMQGTLTIGGTVSTIKATKTSSFYRGCRVEVDAMVNRNFPAVGDDRIGRGGHAPLDLRHGRVGRDGGDGRDQHPQRRQPDQRRAGGAAVDPTPTGDRRGLAVVAARRLVVRATLFGIMFDDDAVPREGAAGFADARLGNDVVIAATARNQPLNNVPAAFLRTLVHEAGHAFNLFHPKHDVHQPAHRDRDHEPDGRRHRLRERRQPVSEQRRVRVLRATTGPRSSTRRIPQVRPGWKNFGWGHGSLSAGLPAPVDVGRAQRDRRRRRPRAHRVDAAAGVRR